MKLKYIVPDSSASEVFLHRLYLLGEPRSFARAGGPVAIRSRSNSCTLYILHSSVYALSGGCGFTVVHRIHVSHTPDFGSSKIGAYCGLNRLIACLHSICNWPSGNPDTRHDPKLLLPVEARLLHYFRTSPSDAKPCSFSAAIHQVTGCIRQTHTIKI